MELVSGGLRNGIYRERWNHSKELDEEPYEVKNSCMVLRSDTKDDVIVNFSQISEVKEDLKQNLARRVIHRTCDPECVVTN